MQSEIAEAIRGLIDGRDSALGGLTRAEQAKLNELYQSGGYSALWLDTTGRLASRAREALTVIDGAADEGHVAV